jgi:hypothetical protein
MNYHKPQINVLGDAANVIQVFGTKDVTSNLDGAQPPRTIDPAYDLDE